MPQPTYYIVLSAAIRRIDLAHAAVQHGEVPHGRVFGDEDEDVLLPAEDWLPQMLQLAAYRMAREFGLSDQCVTLRVEPASPDAPAGVAELFEPCPPPHALQDHDDHLRQGPKCPRHHYQVWPCAETVAAWQLRGADVLAETQRALNQLDRPWTTP